MNSEALIIKTVQTRFNISHHNSGWLSYRVFPRSRLCRLCGLGVILLISLQTWPYGQGTLSMNRLSTPLRSLSALRMCSYATATVFKRDFRAFPCPTRRKNFVDVWGRMANMKGRRGFLKWTPFLRKPNLFERGAGTSEGLRKQHTHINTPWDENWARYSERQYD